MSRIAKSHESTQSKPDSGRAFPLPLRKSNSFGDELAAENFEEFSDDSVRDDKRSSVACWPHHKLLSDIHASEPNSTQGNRRNSPLREPFGRHTIGGGLGAGFKNGIPSIVQHSSELENSRKRSRLSSNKTMDANESIVSNSYFKQYARSNTKKLSHGTESSLPGNGGKGIDSPGETNANKDGDEVDRLKLKNTENGSDSEEDRSRQEEMLNRLKQIMGGEDGKTMGWGVFVKEAARARISSAFQNALDHVVFDATKQELEIIADKTYVDSEKKIGRRKSFKRKKQEAPKLKKILERHGIISKKNLEKKRLKKVLNNLVRRKSKINYMKEWVQSIKRKFNFKIFFNSLITETMILHPKGRFRLAWDIISLFLIFYDLFYVPFTLGFNTNSQGFFYVFDIIKDLFFFMDLLLNFTTAYYDKNGNLVRDPKTISKHYVSTNLFIIDLITALPIPLVADLVIHRDDTRVSFLRLLRFLRFLRLIRVLKAVKLLRIYHKVEEFFYSSLFNGIKSIFSLLFYIILCAHWIACLWHFVGQENEDVEGVSWLTTYYNLKGDTLQERYVASLYFAVMTMITVGYGDITPVTMSERIVSIIAMLSGCAMFAYSMNSIGVLVQNLNARASKTRQLYYSVNKYMEDKNVSKPLRNKILQYLDYMAETQKQDKNTEEQVFAALSDALQDDLKKDINGRVLRDSLLFTSTFGSTFRASLSYYLEHQTFSPGQIIFDENDKSQSLYFLAAGTVEFFIAKTNVVMSSQEKDSHFGEYAFFTGKERTASARSLNFTSVFSIKKEIFLKVIEEFPYEKEMFHMIKDKISLYNDYDKLKMKCFICKQEGHYAKYCFRVHHVPDTAKILADFFAQEGSFRKHHKRRSKKKKFHALAGKKLLAMRVRDLIIDHPQEMKKYIQSDLFKSNSFMPNLGDANHLQMPRVVGERRRSRTLTNMVVLSPQHLMGMESVLKDEDSVERSEYVEKHKNKVIMKLITSSTPASHVNIPVPNEPEEEEEDDGPKFQEEKFSEESSSEEDSDSGSSHDVNAPIYTIKTLGGAQTLGGGAGGSKKTLGPKNTLGNRQTLGQKQTIVRKQTGARPLGNPNPAKLYIQAKTGAEKQIYNGEIMEIPEETTFTTDAPPKVFQRTSTMRKIIESEYEHFAIDMVMNYQVYFPHNNSKKIIDQINQPYKYRKRDVKTPDSGRNKMKEMLARSNTETLKKMKSSSASPEKRGKSVFVKTRYSIWHAAKNTLNNLNLKRKPTGQVLQPSPLGMMATKNQAIAGLIPHVINMGSPQSAQAKSPAENAYARRLSKSLGNLDSLTPMVMVDPSPKFRPPKFLPQHTFEVEDSHEIQSSDLRFVKDSQENVDRSMNNEFASSFKRSDTLQKRIVKRGISLSPIMGHREREDSWRQHSPADSQNDRFFK